MRELKRTLVVGPEGRLEILESDFEPGTEVEILLRPISKSPKALSPEEREAILEHMWKLSDEAIANGMETWSINRINAEIAQRRAGGYWPDELDISKIK